MKLHFILVFLGAFLLLLSTDTGISAARNSRVLSLAEPSHGSFHHGNHGKPRSKVLLRIHRQAEDSYEEGGEYEYEEEENPAGAETPSEPSEPEVEEERERPTSNPPKETDADGEYYDGDNYDEKGEEEETTQTTPSPTTTTTYATTTTTTTPEPYHQTTSMEHIEDEDHYEERYEEERRRYEQETLRRQYENTHGTESSVEESPEDRGREQPHSETDDIEPTTHEESETEDHEEESPETTSTTTSPPEEEAEEGEEENTLEEVEEVPTQPSPSQPPPQEVETEDVEREAAAVEKTGSVEIEESGRTDLERYTEGGAGRNRYTGEIQEEDDEYNEIDEEQHEVEEVPTTPSTTTTTSTTTTPKPDDFYGRRRDPYEYEVEPPHVPTNNNHLEEEEEYYDGEKESVEEVQPSTTTTTTTTTTPAPPPPPPTRIDNELESEEDEEEEENPHQPVHPSSNNREPYVDEYEKPKETHHDITSHDKTETLEYEKEDEEEEAPLVTSTTTTTTTTTPPPTTTTQIPSYFRPYDPDEYEEEDDDDDADGYDLFSRTTSTTAEPTTTSTPSTPAPRYDEEGGGDSSENEIFRRPDPYEEEEEESGEHRIDQARNQYEITPTEDIPKERVIVEEIIPKIECFAGHTLSYDGKECVDENECETDVCGPSQICHNLPGSYKCVCEAVGYIVDPRNPKLCRDLNECQSGNGGCDQDCINVPGSFYCACADDFDLSSDGKRCMRRPTPMPTTTTTTSTTTPPPVTTTTTTTTTIPPPPPPTRRPTSTTTTTTSAPRNFFTQPVGVPGEDFSVRNCPTPPVPRGAGIAYLYCSRSPVGIHHRHSQLERRLLHDWAARRNKTQQQGGRNNLRFRNRRTLLKRKSRQTTYSPGSLCELRCRPGFQLKGQYTLNCNSSDGTWHGMQNGFCQAIPKGDNQNVGIGLSESTPSNEIPRLAPNNEVSGSGFNQFRPTFVNLPTSPPSTTTLRPTYYQPPPPAPTYSRPFRPEIISRPFPTTPAPTTTTTTPTPTTTTVPSTTTTTTTERSTYWTKPQPPNRRPYYFSPSTPYLNIYNTKPVTPSYSLPPPAVTFPSSTTPTTTTTASRNSYIHLTYRFKTPWIKCPDDIKLDLPPNQNTVYVTIPQPQTNVDWWRQVTAEPSWAKGLESESGPGKQRITFRARTAASLNNSAECSFTLEVRDNEPPRVRECPESFSSRLSQGQSAKPVMWMEPHFSDNVRISALKKSHEPGSVLSVGEHLINYEAKDSSDNKARCSFTITVFPPAASSAFNHPPSGNSNFNHRKPVNIEGVVPTSTTTTTSAKPEVHSSMRNVVCYVGKKGRRIVFQSRVVPRGCSEMTVDIAGDAAGLGQNSFNTMNTITQNSDENSATSQISSVSFSSHDHPQQASAFSQSVSNGRNNNRLVHSTSSVTNGEHGTSSKASSYAIAVSSSSRNFDLPFLNPDKQVYEEDFVVPNQPPHSNPTSISARTQDFKTRSGSTREETGGYRYGSPSSSTPPNYNNQNYYKNSSGKYFRHFDTWDTTTNSYAYRNRERD